MQNYSAASPMSFSHPSVYKKHRINEIVMKSRKILLANLLKPLLDEWGSDEVYATIDKLVMQAQREGLPSYATTKSKSERSPRLTAIDLVERLDLEKDRKHLLEILATRFESKDFLPSTADVREFIIMAGERPPTMKNRQESFRNLLRVLLRLSPERLRQVAEAASHAGPAQLGPISDAIAAAGDRLPRRNPDSDR